MGRRIQEKIITGFKAEDLSSDGRAVGRVGEVVIFVKGMVPGDVGTIKVFRKNRRHYEAQLETLEQRSADYTEPKCGHFEQCGGCKWQNLSYAKQLEFKDKQVLKAFEKIAHVSDFKREAIMGSRNEYYYRNKVEFSFSNKRWLSKEEIDSGSDFQTQNALGFHVPRFFDKIVDINECHLIDSYSDEIRNGLRAFALDHKLSFYDIREHHGLLRNMFVRNTSDDQWMVNMVFGENDKKGIELVMEFLKENFDKITSLNYTLNRKKNDSIGDLDTVCYHGSDHITESMGDLKFKIRPKSFYQTNSDQAHQLYDLAKSFANLKENELLYDLYTGTGTIALYCADAVKQVVGIEYVDQAIVDAKENAEANGIDNAKFFHGDMKDILTQSFLKEHGKPDVIITDPPRAGMHPDVIEVIKNSGAQRVVYVSCNPATQARDVDMLKEHYKLTRSRAVDMFPHTNHIENVTLLERI